MTMENGVISSNELGFYEKNDTTQEKGLINVAESRAVAEVQASYVIAKKFPRNELQSYQRIINACKRPFLAEQAIYVYPRGATSVTGPSIRLAEAIAQCWGNLDCGVREISQSNGISIAEAYAIDLETNTRVTKIFHVPHTRDTKKGKYKLTDSRDIYEVVANQGARRLRACILGIVPGDVVEAAVAECKKTMQSGELPISDRIRMMITKFDELGVKTEHLEKRLGHSLDSTIQEEIITLQGIYKAIKDGFASREDFFELGDKKYKDGEEKLNSLIYEKNKIREKEDDKKIELLNEQRSG
jgi:hypothetical protein